MFLSIIKVNSDFIVNSGGIMGCAVELTMKTDTDYKKKVEMKGTRLYTESLINETISKNIKQVFSETTARDGTDIFFREKAISLAKNRLQTPEDNWL